MRGALGLLIYLIIAVIGRLLKNAADERVRRASWAGEVSHEPVIDVESEIEAWEPVAALQGPLPDRDSEGTEEEHQEWTEEDSSERLNARVWSEPVESFSETPELARVAEAIVMSEIIREPRAMRRWPRR